MRIITIVLFFLFLGDFLWWWRGDRIFRRVPRARLWRIAHSLFMAAQVSGILLIVLDRTLDLDFTFSSIWLAFTYIWHCLFIFPMMVVWIPYTVVRGIVLGARRLVRMWAGEQDRRLEIGDRRSEDGEITRRDFARMLGTAAPAFATLGSAAVALWQMQRFRIRSLEVALRRLPPALDGLTIAHVTDIHVGAFTHGDVLDRIVAATNDLQADLVLYTGDLINSALIDLDPALAAATRFQGKHGVFLCEGNHDLFADADEFRRRTRAAGLRLLVNEAETIRIRGVAIQLLGLRWGAPGADPHSFANRGDHAIAQSMAELLPQLQPEVFPILLAHHPHAFDYAENIPLTLAGHTHGGQLMITPNIGCGSMLFRYWSGIYRNEKEDRTLVVSNGTGNWFPLRSRAPAEIVHITLRRG